MPASQSSSIMPYPPKPSVYFSGLMPEPGPTHAFYRVRLDTPVPSLDQVYPSPDLASGNPLIRLRTVIAPGPHLPISQFPHSVNDI